MKSLTGFWYGMGCLSFVLWILLGLPACGPDMEQESFNLTLLWPDGEEEDLGVITCQTECKEAAALRAQEVELKEGEWSYTCCHMTEDSDCSEKTS